MFHFLAETPAIYPAWEALVIRYQVIGKPAHDARLVAAMQGAVRDTKSYGEVGRRVAVSQTMIV